MIAPASRQPEPTTRKQLALWMHEEIRWLSRQVQRMPKRTSAERLVRVAVMEHGMRKITQKADRLAEKIQKGADNDRA